MKGRHAELYEVLRAMLPATFGEVVFFTEFEPADFSGQGQTLQAQELVRHFASLDGGLDTLTEAIDRAAPGRLLPAWVRPLLALLERLDVTPLLRMGLAGALEVDALAARRSNTALLRLVASRDQARTLLEEFQAHTSDPEHLRAIEVELAGLRADPEAPDPVPVWLADEAWRCQDEHRRHALAPRAGAIEDDVVETTVSPRAPGMADLCEGLADRRVRRAGTDAPDEEAMLARMRRGLDEREKPPTLEQLLAAPGGGRWTLVGHPGSGKTTLLRKVAWEAARAALADPAAPLPMRVSLSRWEAKGRPPLPNYLEDHARARAGCAGLGAALATALAEGRALVLFDGLDEVASPDETAREIGLLAAGWPAGVRVVVASRYHGYARPADEFEELALEPLDEAGQADLIRRRLRAEPEKAAALQARLGRERSLREMAGLPLLLTMMCLVHGEPVPPERAPWGPRAQLYGALVERFLLGKPTGAPEKVPLKARSVALAALQEVALGLLEAGEEVWSLGQVEAHLPASIRKWWDGPSDFLREVESITGLLFPIDAARSRYRFLHRSVQEFLAAGALAGRPNADWQERVAHLGADAGRWIEVFLLLAAMSPPTRAGVVVRVVAAKGAAVRALEGCGEVPRDDLIAALQASRVDAETRYDTIGERSAYLASLPARLGEEAAVVVFEALLPGAHAIEQGMVGWVLSGMEGPEARALWDRERFFAVAGRPLREAEVSWATIPGGTFWMGSPEGVGYNDEKPRHAVTVSGFQMTTTPVTQALYARFDPGHRSGFAEHPEHPVETVSWFEAFLFSRWLHPSGRLPTEAEWEYACRAGTSTAYCSGDDESDLARVGWYNGNSQGEDGQYSTHPVGEKPANPWGLYDVHGNVREWCWDWFGSYTADAQTDPQGPSSGTYRVIRGGSWCFSADYCRSAFRNWYVPGARNSVVGFRVVCSSAPAEP